MPRFVILAHDWPAPHLDLLIERDGVLKAWRLPVGFDPAGEAAAARNVDHRLAYLDYEGPVSGGRGAVSRWDGGEADWRTTADDVAVVRLSGAKACGVYELRRVDAAGWRVGRIG